MACTCACGSPEARTAIRRTKCGGSATAPGWKAGAMSPGRTAPRRSAAGSRRARVIRTDTANRTTGITGRSPAESAGRQHRARAWTCPAPGPSTITTCRSRGAGRANATIAASHFSRSRSRPPRWARGPTRARDTSPRRRGRWCRSDSRGRRARRGSAPTSSISVLPQARSLGSPTASAPSSGRRRIPIPRARCWSAAR